MKIVLALAVVLAGCVDQPDVGDPTPSPSAAPAPTGVSHCGDAPQMPGWSYTVVAATASDPGYAKVPEQQWLDHVAWTDTMRQWVACVAAK